MKRKESIGLKARCFSAQEGLEGVEEGVGVVAKVGKKGTGKPLEDALEEEAVAVVMVVLVVFFLHGLM